MITAEKFEESVGSKPENDDLDRCNCTEAGNMGHLQCGWDDERDMPVFIPGVSELTVPNVELANSTLKVVMKIEEN